MNEGAITTRYAKALYKVAEEEDILEIIKDNVVLIYRAIKETPEFTEFLHNPVVKDSVKVKLLNDVFAPSVDTITINFLNLLTKNKREQFLPSICRFFLQMYKEKKGIKEAIIITAVEIDKKHIEEIKTIIKKKLNINADLSTEVDKKIIGGFKLRIEDQQIDASIASKLKKIRTELLNK